MNKPIDFATMFRTAFGEQGTRTNPGINPAGYTAWATGNVEALLESTRIFGDGLQKLGHAMMADGKAALESLTQEATALAQAATPVDLFKAQGDLLRRQVETGLTLASKQGEAILKLTSEALAPIARQVSRAGELLKA